MIAFKKIAAKGKYQDDQAIPDVISYICHPDKTPSHIIGGVQIDPNNIAGSMVAVSEYFGKNSKIRLHHFIISFDPEHREYYDAILNAVKSITEVIGREYQIVYALHEDTTHPHFHFVFNAVSYIDGHRYRGSKDDYRKLIRNIEMILSSYCLYSLAAMNYYPDSNNPHE